MLNRKNGNGKKVRKPITAAASKDENKEQKETKVTTLLLLGALAVAIVMVMAVMTMKVIIGDTAQKTSENPASEQIEHRADTEQVMDAVYLALFSYGLDKNSIKESSQVSSDTESEIKLSIDPFHIETVELKQTITEKLTELGLAVSGEESIIGTNGRVKLLIEFLEPEILEEIKPNSIAFLIDDCGYSIPLAKRLAAIPYPVTFAVIPYTPHSFETAEIARKAGQKVFLHQPMQPVSYPKTDPGKGAILLDMPETDVQSWLEKNVKDIGTIDGFNNHMGSALTQSTEKMQQVFSAIRKYTGTFVDSYTSQGTVAYDECKKAGFRCGINRKFIDNENEYSYIRSKIIEGTELARENGSVIMIGHLREETVSALEKIVPELAEAGYNLVPATELAVR